MLRIGFVTDEISADVHEAVKIGVSWGVQDFELRMIGEERIPEILPSEIRDLKTLMDDYGIRITALSPGCFKHNIEDADQTEHELEVILPRTFALARTLGANIVLAFSFWKARRESKENIAQVQDVLAKAAEQAQAANLILAIENEPGFWCDSGKNTARLLARLDHPNLCANWDAANAFGTKQRPYPEGYESLKKWIANVHIKDTRKTALRECVPVGAGKVDWPGQLAALVRDKLVEHVTIETHCFPLIEMSKLNLQRVRSMLEDACG